MNRALPPVLYTLLLAIGLAIAGLGVYPAWADAAGSISQLGETSTITGLVTNRSGAPYIYARVSLYQLLDDPTEPNWQQIQDYFADQRGIYTITGLSPGFYRLGFADNDYPPKTAPNYYENVADFDAATTISITHSVTITNINAQLQPFGQITGQATNAAGQPIRSLDVFAYQYDTATASWRNLSFTRTDADGHYAIGNLNDGIYTIEFRGDCCIARYVTEFYDNAPNLAAATKISVQIGQTVSGVDAQLADYGKISGRVTGADGAPLAGVIVQALSVIGDSEIGRGDTDSDGNYLIKNLPVGSYRVRFNEGRAYGYTPAYWQNTLDFDHATPISIALDSLVTGIDAQLVKGASISGTVRKANGITIYRRVVLYRYYPNAVGRDPWVNIRTIIYAETDDYSFSGLDPGIYRIGFFDDQDPGYHKEFYSDQPHVELAQSLILAAGQDITGIDGLFTWPGTTDYPPYANDDVITLPDDGRATRLDTFARSVLANDKDDWEHPTVPLTAQLVTPPQHGQVTLAANGEFVYQHDGSAAATDSFSYQAHDPAHASNTATVTIKRKPLKDVPDAMDDRILVMRGATSRILESGAATLTANDLDPENDPLTVTLTLTPQHGLLDLDPSGTFTYTHDGGSTTLDRFTYQAGDGIYLSEPATVTILIKPIATLTFSKTVGIAGIEPLCAPVAEIRAPRNTTMVYCYTVRNTTEVPFRYHTLTDSHLGTLLTAAPYELLPGSSYSVHFTQTLLISTTNVATWTATTGPTGLVSTPEINTGRQMAASVIISSDTDDLDGDTIPDNLERAGDIDHDNIPNFRDTDSDNDGLPDRVEVGANPNAPLDSNNNGVPDYLEGKRQFYLPLITR